MSLRHTVFSYQMFELYVFHEQNILRYLWGEHHIKLQYSDIKWRGSIIQGLLIL